MTCHLTVENWSWILRGQCIRHGIRHQRRPMRKIQNLPQLTIFIRIHHLFVTKKSSMYHGQTQGPLPLAVLHWKKRFLVERAQLMITRGFFLTHHWAILVMQHSGKLEIHLALLLWKYLLWIFVIHFCSEAELYNLWIIGNSICKVFLKCWFKISGLVGDSICWCFLNFISEFRK